MNKIVKQYLKEIQIRLPAGVENREQYLSDMEAAITGSMADIADVTYMSLVKQFGDPKEITDDFLEMQDPRKLMRLKQESNLRTAFFIPAVTGLILLPVFYLFHRNQKKLK